jgi:hypothetical protein
MSLKSALVFQLPALLLGATMPVFAQSIDPKHPAPLQAGMNTASCDSNVGAHYWYFFAEPGSFSGAIARRDATGPGVRANLGSGIAFAPKLQYSVLTHKDVGGVTNFSGSVKSRDKVVIMIDPGAPGLLRATCSYEVHVSGNVSFGDLPANPIVGTYMSNMGNSWGLTKFKDDGTLVTSSGLSGKWSLFDKDTLTYTVDLDNQHLNSKLAPGRGLVDANNTDSIMFKIMK